MKNANPGIGIQEQGLSQGEDPAWSLALLPLHQGRYVRWVCSEWLQNSNKYISSPIFKLLGVPCFWEVL